MPAPTRTLRKDLALSLGSPLLSLTVSLYSAVRSEDAGLHGICANVHAPTRIRQEAYCPVCDVRHPNHYGFPRGKAVGDGFVMIPKEVLDQANAGGEAFKRKVEISVHDAAELVAAMPTGKSYWLTSSNDLAYRTLVAVMRARPDLGFIGKFSFDKVASVYRLLATREGALLLQQLAFPDAVVSAPKVDDGEVPQELVDQMIAFIELVKKPFDPAALTSDRTKIIADYVATQTPVTGASMPDGQPAPTVGGGDFIAVVAAALEAERAKLTLVQGGDGDNKATSKPARKRTAKKTASVATG